MMKKAAMILSLAALSAAPVCLFAQDEAPAPKPPDHYYKLNLTVEQTNDTGQVVNTRSYVEIIFTGRESQEIRTGSKIPIATGEGNGNTQFQYLDVGVNFDVRSVKEIGDRLGFYLAAEISSVAPTEKPTPGLNPTLGEPVIRSNKWQSNVLIPIGKPTVVLSGDDLDDKGRMQVEVTATRIE